MRHRHEVTELFRSPLIRITDFGCGDDNRQDGPEEVSDAAAMVFVRTGCYERLVDGRRHVADCSTVTFFNRGQPFRVRHPAAGGDRCTLFEFRGDVLRDLLGSLEPALADAVQPEYPWSHARCGDRSFLQHVALVRHAAARTGDTPLAVEELALGLARAVLATPPTRSHAAPAEPVTARHQDLAEAARALLAGRLEAAPGLAGLAAALGCSPFHLARVFHAVTGTPLHGTLVSLRLRAALEPLAEGAEDLTSLALSLGFSSHGHFSTCFRRAFGMTPSGFRDTATRGSLADLLRN